MDIIIAEKPARSNIVALSACDNFCILLIENINSHSQYLKDKGNGKLRQTIFRVYSKLALIVIL